MEFQRGKLNQAKDLENWLYFTQPRDLLQLKQINHHFYGLLIDRLFEKLSNL